MLVEVVSVVLRVPNDSTSEESRDLSLLVLWGRQMERQRINVFRINTVSAPLSKKKKNITRLSPFGRQRQVQTIVQERGSPSWHLSCIILFSFKSQF